jgi:hypothetical protein
VAFLFQFLKALISSTFRCRKRKLYGSNCPNCKKEKEKEKGVDNMEQDDDTFLRIFLRVRTSFPKEMLN